jgi:hypothetical protein
MTGSVSSADSAKSELLVGTSRHPSIVCPNDSATYKDNSL